MRAEEDRAVKRAVRATIDRFGALGTSPHWTEVARPAIQRLQNIEEIVCYCLGTVAVRSV